MTDESTTDTEIPSDFVKVKVTINEGMVLVVLRILRSKCNPDATPDDAVMAIIDAVTEGGNVMPFFVEEVP